MKKIALLALLALFLMPAAVAFAKATPDQENDLVKSNGSGGGGFPGGTAGIVIGACIGAGLVIMGGAKGIGMIGSHAVDAIARQPEAGGRIFTSMIISAAHDRRCHVVCRGALSACCARNAIYSSHLISPRGGLTSAARFVCI